MKKPVAISITGLKCDAPGCDYHQDEPVGNTYEEYAKWLNQPCPKCGANLLTEADLKTTHAMMKITGILNRLLWPLSLISKKRYRYKLGMDGSGSVNPSFLGEEEVK